MIISHKYKFIFIKTRKTAGTSIESYLSQYCDDMDVLTSIHPPIAGHEPRNHDGFFNHIKASELRDRMDVKLWNSYYKFCVERNPWDKTLSYYHMMNYRAGGKLSLEKYFELEDYCVDFSLYTEKSIQSDIIVDRVIKYEFLLDELNQVFKYLGIPFSGDLGIYAKSEYRKDKRHYQDVLSSNQANLISRVFSDEISFFGYKY